MSEGQVYKGILILKILIIAILIWLCASISSCSKDAEKTPVSVSHSDKIYRSTILDVSFDRQYSEIHNVLSGDNCYYLVVSSLAFDFDVDSQMEFFLQKYDDAGNLTEEYRLPDNTNVFVSNTLLENRFLFITTEGVCALDLDSGSINTIIDQDNALNGVCSFNDGYAVMSSGRIEKYSVDDNPETVISDPSLNWYYGHNVFYEDDGEYYVITHSMSTWKYYRVDFDHSDCTLILDTFDLPTSVGNVSFCSGPYIFTETGEYKFDPQQNILYQLCDYNSIDVVPPSATLVSNPEYVGLNDDKYAVLYYYSGQLSQAVIYDYDPEATNQERIPIIVGGYGCRTDIPLMTAVYRFNTSQNEYRAYIEDYRENPDFADLGNASSKAALLKYFGEGNTPDIFYGTFFDYAELYSSGITQDISAFLDDERYVILDMMIPCIRELMFDDSGKCIRLFSGFQMMGYMCFDGMFDNPLDVTLEDVGQLSERLGIDPFYPDSASNMAYQIISKTEHEGSIDYDELYSILSYCYSNGYSSNYYVSSSYSYDDCLLFPGEIYSVADLSDFEIASGSRIDYIGYPSQDSVTHPVFPRGEVGLSSDTDHPGACVELISYLFDEDVQRLNYMNNLIPVNESVMNEFLDYSVNHELIPETDYNTVSFFSNYLTATPEARDDLYEAVLSADSVVFDDWGLRAIIEEEVESYYSEGKTVDEIAESLRSRLNIYWAERDGEI